MLVVLIFFIIKNKKENGKFFITYYLNLTSYCRLNRGNFLRLILLCKQFAKNLLFVDV